MTDRYTKVVLTVIALALVGIIAQGLVRSATAQPNSCGISAGAPCYVMANTPLRVQVTNK